MSPTPCLLPPAYAPHRTCTGGKEVGVAPRVNRESSHRNSYLHEALVLVMGPVSQPRRSFLLGSTGNTDGGCGVPVQNGPHLGKSQPGSTFVCHRISPHLSTVFVLLQMMLKKLTKSFCIFVSNIFRKILFSSLQIIPVICLSILELTLTYCALMDSITYFSASVTMVSFS